MMKQTALHKGTRRSSMTMDDTYVPTAQVLQALA